MASGSLNLIDFDWASFDPWRVTPVRHQLTDHPLLQVASLIKLGERLEAKGLVRSHTNAATAHTSFNSAPSLHPNRKSATATLSDIASASAWMSLLNVQSDPVYRTLVDEALESVRPGIERIDPGMCYRGGWIFVSSPRTVTPFHFDTEHGILLQISGRKRIYSWDPTDNMVASEQARDRFFTYHDRSLLVWKDEFKERAHKFDVEPGMGCYQPCTSPHLVEVGDEPSVTISFTFYTDSTRRKATLHRAHQRLRDHGIELGPIGSRPLFDSALHAAYRAFVSTKKTVRQLVGKHVIQDNAPYAYPR